MPKKSISKRKESGASKTKAVVTPLVKATFEKIFEGLIDDSEDNMKKAMDECTHCKNLSKLAIADKSKQACGKQVCSDQMKIMELTIPLKKLNISTGKPQVMSMNRHNTDECIFVNEPFGDVKGQPVYDRIQVGKEMWKIGDCVYLGNEIGQFVYFYLNKRDKFCAHLRIFLKSSETILIDIADDQELFVSRKCKNVNLDQVGGFANVTYWKTSETWSQDGGIVPSPPPIDTKDPSAFFYHQSYFDGRFETAYPPNTETVCLNCETNEAEKNDDKIHLLEPIPSQ